MLKIPNFNNGHPALMEKSTHDLSLHFSKGDLAAKKPKFDQKNTFSEQIPAKKENEREAESEKERKKE